MGGLILGPMLRYVSGTEATVWVETEAPAEVEVLGTREPTFCVNGHHYALVCLRGLEPGSTQEYDVKLDGERVWPEEDDFPPTVLRTLGPDRRRRLVFGSCRVAVPHRPPYTLTKDEDPEHGREIDALYALAMRMRELPVEEWPDLLLMLGDQVYADEDAPETRRFIRERRGVDGEPGDQVADFEEYTRLYREAWGDQAIRWLLSVVPTTMIFDDHDVHDDWNTSISWLEEMRSKPWWDRRITGALASYWVYQHLGNLSPDEIEDRGILDHVRSEPDAGHALQEWARDVDWGSDGRRWSYSRDLGDDIRLVVLDSREGRVLGKRPRRMFDDEEWKWLKGVITGDVRHLLIADTLPIFLPQAIHNLESWDDAVAHGAWTRAMKSFGEWVRRALDLEHWGAFPHSFERMLDLIRAAGAGERGDPPASIVTLGGDIHHAYLARVEFPAEEHVASPVWQAVCSPFRNALSKRERRIARAGDSKLARRITRGLARSAGVKLPEVEWRLVQEPTFDNQFATLDINGDRADLRIEKTVPGDWRRPRIETSLERRLA
ncbi:MAG TPA: alkaline phosphatase D family protein [Solirubrobacterales bacterium]